MYGVLFALLCRLLCTGRQGQNLLKRRTRCRVRKYLTIQLAALKSSLLIQLDYVITYFSNLPLPVNQELKPG